MESKINQTEDKESSKKKTEKSDIPVAYVLPLRQGEDAGGSGPSKVDVSAPESANAAELKLKEEDHLQISSEENQQERKSAEWEIERKPTFSMSDVVQSVRLRHKNQPLRKDKSQRAASVKSTFSTSDTKTSEEREDAPTLSLISLPIAAHETRQKLTVSSFRSKTPQRTKNNENDNSSDEDGKSGIDHRRQITSVQSVKNRFNLLNMEHGRQNLIKMQTKVGEQAAELTEAINGFPEMNDRKTVQSLLNKAVGDVMKQNRSFKEREKENSDTTNSETEEEKFKKAYQVAEEILLTERSFFDIIKMLNEDFRNTVVGEIRHSLTEKEAISQISMAELNSLLRWLPEIQILSQELVKDLELAVNNWSKKPGQISEIFIKKGPFLNLYSQYIDAYENTKKKYSNLMKVHGKFEIIVKEFQRRPCCKGLSIIHHMITPIQRIPRYCLLLRDYKKQLPSSAKDLITLKRYEDSLIPAVDVAINIVEFVTENANLYLSRNSELLQLLKIQEMIGQSFKVIMPSRKFIKSGRLMKQSRKEPQPRLLFLFSDTLVYCHILFDGANCRLKDVLSLKGMQIDKEDGDPGASFAFEFTIYSQKRSLVFGTDDIQELNSWTSALIKTIAEFNAREESFQIANSTASDQTKVDKLSGVLGYSAPVWIPDVKVTMCQICCKGFSPLYRKHHCRACGRIVCQNCSTFRAALPYRREKKATRICEICFPVLVQNQIFVKNKSQKTKTNVPRCSTFFNENAKDPSSKTSGFLTVKFHKEWKRRWAKIKNCALFFYKASEDATPWRTLALIGWDVTLQKLDKHHSTSVLQLNARQPNDDSSDDDFFKRKQSAPCLGLSFTSHSQNADMQKSTKLHGAKKGWIIALSHMGTRTVLIHFYSAIETPESTKNQALKWFRVLKDNATFNNDEIF